MPPLEIVKIPHYCKRQGHYRAWKREACDFDALLHCKHTTVMNFSGRSFIKDTIETMEGNYSIKRPPSCPRDRPTMRARKQRQQ